MFSLVKTNAAVAVLTASLAAGDAASAGQASTSSTQPNPVRCEIQVTKSGDMIALAGIVHAAVAVSGSYSFGVTGGGGGGSTNITQGGPFVAHPGEAVALGSVTVSAAGATYDLVLDVTANGAKVQCRERIGGSI